MTMSNKEDSGGSSEGTEQTMRVLFAKAGVPNDRFDVFTADCLREVAANDPRATFDEETQELWLES